MTKDALELAKKIADQIWQSYDDTYGYQTEKRERNAAVPTGHPDNIWFFWNQFDSNNQEKFLELALDSDEPGASELQLWATKELKRTREAILRLHGMGIDL